MAWGDNNYNWGSFQWGQHFPVNNSIGNPFESGLSTGSVSEHECSYESTGSGRIRLAGTNRPLKTITAALVDIGFELGSNPFTEERLILVDADELEDTVVVGPTNLGIVGTVNLQPSASNPLTIVGSEELSGGIPELDAKGATIGVRIQADNVRIIRISTKNNQTSFSVEANNIRLDGVRGGSSVGISANGVSGLDILNAVLDPDKTGIDLTDVVDFLIAHCSIRIASTEDTSPASGVSIVNSDGGIQANVVKVRKVRGSPTVCISISDSPYLVVDGNTYNTSQGGKVGRLEITSGSGFTEAIDLSAWQTLSGFDSNSFEFDPLFANDPIEGFLTDVNIVDNEVVIEDTAQNFATDSLQEQIIEFTDGTLSGEEFLVRTNTATTITLQDSDTGNLPSIGDEYRIQSGRGNLSTNLRPRARSAVVGKLTPLSEVEIDGDGNIRSGDLVSAGAFEVKDVRLTDRRSLILEILAGISDDHLSTVFAGKGGSLDRFTPKFKSAGETGLTDQIVSAPIRGAAVIGNRVTFDLAMGIDQLFRDNLLDNTIDFQDELGIGTEDGRIAIIRSGQRIPLDYLQQITHEVKVAIEVSRS